MPEPPTAVLLIGIPASGKTSFWQATFRDTHVRISLDMLRTRARERALLEVCIQTMQPFLVDNTNASAAERRGFLASARTAGYRISGYYFQSRMADCLARNAQRPEAQRIPDAGVRGTAARLERPSLSEGFDDLWYVSLAADGRFSILEWDDEIH